MNTEELVSFDVMRLTEITDAEYDYIKQHPHSKKMREDITFANADNYDFSRVTRFVRKMEVGKYVNALYKDELIWGFYERDGGLLVNTIRHSLEDLYGEVKPYTFYPINKKIANILEALGMDVHHDANSVVCVMFQYSEKYVQVEE